MTTILSNLAESEAYVRQSLIARGAAVQNTERVLVDRSKYGTPIYHSRIWTEGCLYQVKYQQKEHVPLADDEVRTAHQVNERLKYAIRSLGGGNATDIGINQSVLFDLMEIEQTGQVVTFLLNAVGRSIVFPDTSVIYWCRAKQFYDLAMAWGTVIYNSSAYGGTVFLVPTGWMELWADPVSAPPALASF